MVYFQTKNTNSGLYLEGFGMVNVGIFCGHLEYLTAIWYILWPFGTFCGHFPVLVCCTKKNLATLLRTIKVKKTVESLTN
jgi:hypothetical protein